VSPAQTAELIEMPSGMWTWVSPRNCVLWGPDPHGSGHFWGGWCWNFPACCRVGLTAIRRM